MGHLARAGQVKLGSPMLERFDENARTVLARAREEASALGRECIDTEHVLLGVCHQDAEDSDPVLASAGITTQSVRAWLAQHGGQPGGAPDGSLPFTRTSGSSSIKRMSKPTAGSISPSARRTCC